MKNEDYHAEENLNIVKEHSPEYLEKEMTDEEYADYMYHKEMDESSQELEEEIISSSDWDEIEKQSLAALNQFQKGLTKVDIKEMASNAVENLMINGNPLQIAEALSGMEMFVKEVKEDKKYKDYVREEAEKYPFGYVSKSGAKIECAEVGNSYDFSQCNDPYLPSMESQVIKFADKVKERKEFLKAVPVSGLVITNEEDGETVKIYPPTKSSTSSIKVTLAKGF